MPATVEGASRPITEKIRDVGEELARTLQRVVAATPGRPTRPSQLSRELGINRAIASRVLGAITRSDPLEVVHLIPGPEPLRSLLRAASERDVPADLIGSAEEAVGRFDGLIRTDAGTRSALDAMISSTLPSAREKVELGSKYSIFKGMSQLKGVQAETWLGIAIVTPSATDPDRYDLTWISGALGIQRLRSDVTIRFSYRSLRGDAGDEADETESMSVSAVPMERFCRNPPARVEASRAGNVINYTLPGDRVGPKAMTDTLVVDHHTAVMKRHPDGGPHHRSSLFVEPAFPVNLLVFDAILHEDAFAGSDPQLVIYDTNTKGIANVNDPTRDIDRMDLQESIELLGRGIGRLRCADVPHYADMLGHLVDEFGWDAAKYRGYRCRMQYPVYGWQVSMAFRAPTSRPSGSTAP